MSGYAAQTMPVTLLIVDDNPLYRHLAFMGVRGAEEMPVLPVFAASMDEAMEQFKRERPQVTFLDINLPGSGDGLDLLDQFLTINPQAYVVMMTGNGDFESVQRAKDAGAQGYILKPFNAQKLLEAMLGYRMFCNAGKPLRRSPAYVPPPPKPESEERGLGAVKEAVLGLQTIMANWQVVYVGREEVGVSVALDDMDCRVSRFENGYAAWTYLTKNHADVLLVDAFLPDMDGLHLADQVRLMEEARTIPTYTIGVFESNELVHPGRMRLVGMASHFVKPVRSADVLAHLRDYAAKYRDLMSPKAAR